MSGKRSMDYLGWVDESWDAALDGPRFARLLSDALCEDLTDLLVELQLTRRRQPSAEVDRHVRTVRDVLVAVRRMVYELHQVPMLDSAVGIAVSRQGEARATDD